MNFRLVFLQLEPQSNSDFRTERHFRDWGNNARACIVDQNIELTEVLKRLAKQAANILHLTQACLDRHTLTARCGERLDHRAICSAGPL